MSPAPGNMLTRKKIQQLLRKIGREPAVGKSNEGRPAADSQAEPDGDIQPVEYDWHQPHYFNDKQVEKLSRFASRCATSVGSKFSSLCQGSFEAAIDSTSQHFASHFLDSGAASQAQPAGNYYLPFSSPANRSSSDEQAACGFVSIPAQTAATWTRLLLGETEPEENSDRVLTKLEESLLLDVALLVVESLGQACPPQVSIEFKPAANALTNHLPLELKGAEQFYKITLSIKQTGSENKSEAHILVLCDDIAPVVGETGRSAGRAGPEENSDAMLSHIQKISVSVTARIATVGLTLEQMIGLNAGDIVLLDKKVDELAKLVVEGRELFSARPAKSGGNYAVVIEKAISAGRQNSSTTNNS